MSTVKSQLRPFQNGRNHPTHQLFIYWKHKFNLRAKKWFHVLYSCNPFSGITIFYSIENKQMVQIINSYNTIEKKQSLNWFQVHEENFLTVIGLKGIQEGKKNKTEKQHHYCLSIKIYSITIVLNSKMVYFTTVCANRSSSYEIFKFHMTMLSKNFTNGKGVCK